VGSAAPESNLILVRRKKGNTITCSVKQLKGSVRNRNKGGGTAFKGKKDPDLNPGSLFENYGRLVSNQDQGTTNSKRKEKDEFANWGRFGEKILNRNPIWETPRGGVRNTF